MEIAALDEEAFSLDRATLAMALEEYPDSMSGHTCGDWMYAQPARKRS